MNVKNLTNEEIKILDKFYDLLEFYGKLNEVNILMEQDYINLKINEFNISVNKTTNLTILKDLHFVKREVLKLIDSLVYKNLKIIMSYENTNKINCVLGMPFNTWYEKESNKIKEWE